MINGKCKRFFHKFKRLLGFNESVLQDNDNCFNFVNVISFSSKICLVLLLFCFIPNIVNATYLYDTKENFDTISVYDSSMMSENSNYANLVSYLDSIDDFYYIATRLQDTTYIKSGITFNERYFVIFRAKYNSGVGFEGGFVENGSIENSANNLVYFYNDYILNPSVALFFIDSNLNYRSLSTSSSTSYISLSSRISGFGGSGNYSYHGAIKDIYATWSDDDSSYFENASLYDNTIYTNLPFISYYTNGSIEHIIPIKASEGGGDMVIDFTDLYARLDIIANIQYFYAFMLSLLVLYTAIRNIFKRGWN